jgi:PAS domain S-box-containing protein
MVRNRVDLKSTAADVLAGGGELGALMRERDWARSPLGPVESWPLALRTAVRIMLTSRQPMFVWWGGELINLYNDAYRSIAGGKHPRALGQPASVVWREIWDQVEPRARLAMQGNEGTYDEALLLIMERNGYPEETYYTFSYSPVPDGAGGIGGILCANTEDTPRILGARQVALLRYLASHTADARTIAQACRRAVSALGSNRRDLPFAMLYLLDPGRSHATLAGSSGIAPGIDAAPQEVSLSGPSPWPFAEVTASGKAQVVKHLRSRWPGLPCGDWDVAPDLAAVLPIAPSGETGRAAVLVAALNPYRLPDDDYLGFLGLVAGQIGAAIGNAHAYEQERRRAESLAELDRAKTTFFSNVSHEFRTPLMLLLGPAEDALADAGNPLSPPQRERMLLLQRNGLRLLKLVNTLLDFSRFEAGRMQAVYEPVDLAVFTAELASLFQSAVARAGLRFEIDAPPLGEPVFVDRDMWEKVVLNLISNAFKFTLEGSIRVAVDRAGKCARLRVIDTGAGIPRDQIPHLFERFHRVVGARGRSHEGTGIGLALVQELTRLHGGAVTVESSLSAGSTFTVEIPFGKAHLPPERIGAVRSQPSTSVRADAYVEEALRWLPPAGNDGAALRETAEPGKRGRHILLADDNADMREYVAQLLRDEYEVETAANGSEALHALGQRLPDLLLADVMMPELDGFGLLRAVREDPRVTGLPVILVSARAGEEATIEGLSAGADDYLVKPFSARELKARVDSTLKLSAMRRQAVVKEQQLRAEAEEARTRLAEVLESIGEGFISLDRESRFLYVNRAFAHLARRSAGELLGKRIRDVFPDLAGAAVEREFNRAMKEMQPLRFEFFYQSLEIWLDLHACPRASGLTVFIQDISEKRRLDEQLRQSAKLESLGVMAGGVAHDFNNLLVGILGNLSLALEILSADVQVRPLIAEALNAGGRAADLTNQLLAYSGKGRFSVEAVDPGELVRENLSLLRSLLSANIKLELELEPDTPPIEADRTQVQQIVMNLILNAAEAIQGSGGRVRLATSVVRVDEHYRAGVLGWTPPPGRYVRFTVEDNGAGMDAEIQKKIFDPFFTTKFTGRGLGLAAVLGIVRSHNGDIRLESAPGVGTRFDVLFPASSAGMKASAAPAVSAPGQGTILIVDDDETVRKTAEAALRKRGYETVAVEGAREAAAALRERDGRISLVILDLTMPELDGEQALPLLRSVQPSVPIVLSSGFSEADVSRRFAGKGIAGFLQKPYTVATISSKVAEILAGGGATGASPVRAPRKGAAS